MAGDKNNRHFSCAIIELDLAPGFADLIKIFPKKYAPFQETPLADVFYDKINVLVWFVIIFIIGLIVIAIIKPLFKVVLEFPIIKQFNSLLVLFSL